MDSITVEKEYLTDGDNSSDEEEVSSGETWVINEELKKKKKKFCAGQCKTLDANIKKRGSDESSEDSDSDSPSISAYEKLRLKNIQERDQLMRNLGIQEDVQDLKALKPQRNALTVTPSRKRIKIEKQVLPRREHSQRLNNLALNKLKNVEVPIKIESEIQEEEEVEEEDEEDKRLLGSMPMAIENQESEELLMRLAKIKCEINTDSDMDPCNIKGLKEKLSSYCLTNDEKLFCNGIRSLEIHPTTGKKLVIAGSNQGEIGLWDLELERFAIFKPHCSPVNCLSVSISEPTKLFSTSLDGTFICGDLELSIFSNVYATADFYEKVTHLTWHDQLDSNRFLLAHGSGRVGMIDLRDPKVDNSWYPCFDLSAKTVHHHPIHDNYFLVSSGSGCSSNVYDLRNCSSSKAEPVSKFPHNKGFTSAFFSPSGDKVLTTCKDDFLKIYTSPLEDKPTLKTLIPHNINAGLCVLRAKWYPGRDDAFIIGSLMIPRRIQVYGIYGRLLYQLKDPEMNTITKLVSVHPSLPFVAGGNLSGRVYIFSTKDQ